MRYASPSRSREQGHHSPRPRTSLRVRNVAAGVIYNLIFEGDVQRLSGKQLRVHLARISHVPPEEQQLFVHGRSFTPNVVGAAVGLRSNDVIDFFRTVEDGRGHDGLGACNGRDATANASSLRPFTEVATPPPQGLWQGNPGPVGSPPKGGGRGARSLTASMASIASASTRRAPSPDRLVNPTPPATRGGQCQVTTSDDIAYQQKQQQHNSAMLNDSSLPLWASATTLSSLPSGAWSSGMGVGAESPRPQMPAKPSSSPMHGFTPASVLSYAYPRSSQRLQKLPTRPSVSPSDYRRQGSYEVASPPLPLPPRLHNSNASHPPPPPPSRPGPMMDYRDPSAAPSAGLNHSRYDEHRSNLSEEASCGLSTPQHLPRQQRTYRPHAVSSVPHNGASPPVSGLATHSAVIRADELETILDEENYRWRMEAYRFHTERENRLTALQHRQRELMLESARYDQEVAEVERRLAREQRKLAELQRMMVHNATTSFLFDRGHGSQEQFMLTQDAQHAIPTYPPMVHCNGRHGHMHHGTDATLYHPTGAANSVAVMEEEEVIADV
ncbi:hypothetical protein JKF63_03380 [Porcisia hertigi]|uniref:Ubiquitin-like domain-containing protein n=1 Tax=Porcisia hertigi TaxID=2761500 RepID=A0A836IRL7_9TRYP|nr:hypothetical protein JKF63_03380 [Porcisia hertigi]